MIVWNIILMRDPQIFSLTTILNSHQIENNLLQHMIHQIKSPLQQQSIDLTNDHSITLQKIPKRPNIPPPPARGPVNLIQNHQFSRTYDSVSVSLEKSRKRQESFRQEEIQSIFSPLDHQINHQDQSVRFCGGLLDSMLKEERNHEVEFVGRSSNYKRKPIFNKQQHKTKTKNHKSIEQACHHLARIQQNELASFIFLMSSLEKQFGELKKQQQSLNNNLTDVYQILSSQSAYVPEKVYAEDEHIRIFRRLKAKNTGEVISKIIGIKSNQRQQSQEKLLKVFSIFNNVQHVIGNFLKDKESVAIIHHVSDFLNHNYHNMSFKKQLQSLCQSLDIQISTYGFQFIWEKFDKKMLSKEEMVQGLGVNSLIVRGEQNFEENLVQKGFIRNI